MIDLIDADQIKGFRQGMNRLAGSIVICIGESTVESVIATELVLAADWFERVPGIAHKREWRSPR